MPPVHELPPRARVKALAGARRRGWGGGMDAERANPPIEPGPEPDTSTAADGQNSDPTLDHDDEPIE